MKKTLLHITLGTLFLILACATPGHAQVPICDSLTVTPESATVTAGNGVFDYYLTVPGICVVEDAFIVDFSGMANVTGASLSSNLASDQTGVTQTSTQALFGFEDGIVFTSDNTGTMEIDCASCMSGPINWAIGGDDPSIAGPNAATVTGAPEPGSIALLLSGLAGLALLTGFARRKQRTAAARHSA